MSIYIPSSQWVACSVVTNNRVRLTPPLHDTKQPSHSHSISTLTHLYHQMHSTTAASNLCKTTAGEIVFNTRRKVFTHQGKVLSGLLPTLRTLLYPSYNWETARSQSPLPPQTKNRGKGKGKGKSLAFHGKASGKKLDRQLHQAVRFAREHDIPPIAFINPVQRRRLLLPRKATVELQRFTSRMSPATKNFMALCHQLKLRLHASQTVVGDVQARVATAVDVTLMNMKNEPIIIENKVGYSSYLHAHTGRMQYPFRAQTNSPFNQHQVQLTATVSMYNAQYPHNPCTEAYVWHHREDGITSTPLQDWAREGTPTLFRQIENRSR